MHSPSMPPFKPRAIAAALLCVAALAGCASQQSLIDADGKDAATVFAADKPRSLQPFYRQLYRDGEWNATLNFNMLGLAAMQEGQFAIARKAFDQAIARIDQIYADDPSAKKALSVFSEEKVKDFKGEPYERAMTYYYRGLLYLQEGDYQNARASFLAADLQGTMAEKETFAGDFGLMKYLAGWSSTCSGDASRGKALIEEAKRSDSKIAGLPDKPGSAMLLIDSGLAPQKKGVGEYKEMMAFEPGGPPDGDIIVRGSEGSLEVKEFVVGGDVYVQASTRGGRQIDAVLDGKAKFKGDSNVAGDVAIGVGTAMMSNSYNNSNMGMAGAIVGLLGLVAKGVSAATTPAADVRAWTSLPANVMLFTADVQPKSPITLASATSAAAVLPIQASQNGCWIGWGRTRSALAATDGGTAKFSDGKVETSNREEKNKAFRVALTTDFAPSPVAANVPSAVTSLQPALIPVVAKKETASAAK